MQVTARPPKAIRQRLLGARFSYVDLAVVALAVLGLAIWWQGRLKEQYSQQFQQARDILFQNQALADVKVAEEAPSPVAAGATQTPSPYSFSVDWFSINIPVWEKLMENFQGRADLRYLEIGVYEGRSAIWMLENVLTHPTARLTGVDPFDGPWKERCFENVQASGAAEKVELITGYSQLVLRDLPLESFDIIYIDGSHAKDAVLEDAVLSWRLLKEGGLLIFDDYRWVGCVGSRAIDSHADAPKLAVDAFAQCFDQHFQVVHNSYQLVLKKTAP